MTAHIPAPAWPGDGAPVVLPPSRPAPTVIGWRSAFRIAVAQAIVSAVLMAAVVLVVAAAAALAGDDTPVGAVCDPVNDAGEQLYCP